MSFPPPLRGFGGSVPKPVHSEEMTMISVFGDIPPVPYRDDVLTGMSGHTGMASSYEYPHVIDHDLYGGGGVTSQEGRISPVYAMPPVFTPKTNYFQNNTLPYPGLHQQMDHQFTYPPIRTAPWSPAPKYPHHQPLGMPYDTLSPNSDDSSYHRSENSSSPSASFDPSISSDDSYDRPPVTPGSGRVEQPTYHQGHCPHLFHVPDKNVALKDLQYGQDIDAHHEIVQDQIYLEREPMEGFAPKQEREETVEIKDEYDTPFEDDDKSSDYNPSKRAPHTRADTRRRARQEPQKPMQKSAGINKSKTKNQRPRGPSSVQETHQHFPSQAFEKRRYICSFSRWGCTGRFPNKNEWKRHMQSQHLQLGFYRCDQGDCNPYHTHNISNQGKKDSTANGATILTFNDFNRKDLFTQHLRRMHAPWNHPGSHGSSKKPTQHQNNEFEASLETIRQKCYTPKREPPQRSMCEYCSRLFQGPSSWDDRTEHVGRHLENGDTIGDSEDDDLKDWAIKEGILKPNLQGSYDL